MIMLPPPPGPGDRISVTFIRDVLRYIRSITPIQGPGVRLSSTPNGTVFTADAQARGKSSVVPKGCFAIALYTPEDAESPEDSYLAVLNRYYRRGHILFELEADVPPAIDELVSTSKPLLALVSTMDVGDPDVTMKSFTDYNELKNESLDESKAVTPLYLCRFSDEGKYAGIEVDFRDIPVFDASES